MEGRRWSWLQQEEGHSREWVLRDQHGSRVEIELAVAKVEVGGQWGISLPPSCEISHVYVRINSGSEVLKYN